jgi:hypothetical protein
MATRTLTLRCPHAGQRRIRREAARFNVISCGRRFGKTIIGTNLLVEAALLGLPVAWASPTYKMLIEVWRDAVALLQPVLARNGIDKQNKRITLLNGGVIEFWSLGSAESIRGRKYRRFIIDEAAMDPALVDHWNLVIRPTLTDYKGDGFFLSTPKGRNGFWQFFQRGEDPAQLEWASFQMPTATNPHIDPSEIEAARGDVPELVFLQEYLAQFIDDNAGLFRRVLGAAVVEAHVDGAGLPLAIPGHSYVFGVDWARSGDYTVISVVDTTTNQQVYLDRFNQVDYALQAGRLTTLYEAFQPSVIVAEQNNMGGPQIEALRTAGLPVQPFVTTNASKKEIIDSLALGIESGGFQILNDPVQVGELLSFEQTRLPSGLFRYAAAGNGHDDTVIALALAKYAAGRPSPTGYIDFA